MKWMKKLYWKRHWSAFPAVAIKGALYEWNKTALGQAVPWPFHFLIPVKMTGYWKLHNEQ